MSPQKSGSKTSTKDGPPDTSKKPTPSTSPVQIPVARQLACAKKELARRIRTYPELVGGKRMNHYDAQEGIEDMRAIVRTLERL